MRVHIRKRDLFIDHYQEHTVVLIHMRQATLAPMAQAPAVPPRTALLAALSITCLKESSSFAGPFFSTTAASEDDMV